ncbi:hypothetical protein KIN20_015846 [Parelaphostrongylus tenuis]|uniref:Uncharacterized protein n=1 Tax=Parelaphostrongylus tenuis TaxID=148309 RepID=A0AAD5N0S7_PARTN|nr:hypothetical protein KIN20_015846 [Parelaphostrongylus tenuis]
MVYSDSGSATQVAGISRSADAVRALVMRSVMQALFDVLEQQDRAAGLPDFVITSILNQLTVNITYALLECKRVVVISGNEETSNTIMANWSRGMWQSVVNRVVRALTSGPLGSHLIF